MLCWHVDINLKSIGDLEQHPVYYKSACNISGASRRRHKGYQNNNRNFKLALTGGRRRSKHQLSICW